MRRLIVICAAVVLFVTGYAGATGTWTALDYPGAIFPGTEAYGISGNSIVGRYVDSSSSYRGFLYDGTSWTTLPIEASGIDGSYVVGNASISRDQLYNMTTGNSTTLNVPGAATTAAYGISGNNIVGYYSSSGFHGFLYDGTSYTALNYPGVGTYSTKVYGISGNNIVGAYDDRSGDYGFLYNGTNWTTLNYPGAVSTRAYGISGDSIVGYYGDNSGTHGFLYDGTSWTTLDYPGATKTWAYGISGSSVVGKYQDSSGYHGFVYTVPEPATAMLLGIGMVLFRLRNRPR